MNPVQFACGIPAQAGGRPATKMVWREPVDAGFASVLPDHVPDGFLRQSIAPGVSVLVYPPEQLAGAYVGSVKPFVEQSLDPARHRYGPGVAAFTFQIDYGPVVFPLLYVAEIQVHRLVPPKPASEQKRQERTVSFTFQKLRVRRLPEPLGLFWR